MTTMIKPSSSNLTNNTMSVDITKASQELRVCFVRKPTQDAVLTNLMIRTFISRQPVAPTMWTSSYRLALSLMDLN